MSKFKSVDDWMDSVYGKVSRRDGRKISKQDLLEYLMKNLPTPTNPKEFLDEKEWAEGFNDCLAEVKAMLEKELV